MDRRLSSLEAGTSNAAYSVETDLADIEDMLSYCNDILCTGVRPSHCSKLWPAASMHLALMQQVWHAGDSRLSHMLMQCLWDSFIRPILIEPLQQLVDPSQLTGGEGSLQR